jgi:integrase
MPAVMMARLRADLEELYIPPAGKVATWKKIRQVLDQFELHAGVRKTSDLTAPAISRWLQAYPDRKPVTTFSLLSSFRRACSYAKLQGWLRVSPFQVRSLENWVRDYEPDEYVEMMEGDESRKHHPLADLRAVMNLLKVRSVRSWKDERLFALTCATLYTGARAKEVQASRKEDWDLEGRWFRVRNNQRRTLKTRRSKRPIPLAPELLPVLTHWLPQTESVWAFPGVRRKVPWINGAGASKVNGFQGQKPLDFLKRLGEELDIDDLTFLSLRHSLATLSESEFGIPDLLTQKMYGHTKRKTTEGYRGWDGPSLHKAIARISFGLVVPDEPQPTEGDDSGDEGKTTRRRA